MATSQSEDYSPSDTIQSQSTFSSAKSRRSSGSGGSARSDTGRTERDEDFTKDNAASPVDLECHIQEERITKAIDEALYKIKVAICLPRLVREGTLEGELSQQSYDEVMFIYRQYDNKLFSTSLLNMAAIDDIKAGDLSMHHRLSPEQGHLICILNNCPNLRSIVEEMIYQMKSRRSETKSSDPLLEYLLVFEHFRELFVRQLRWTAAEVWHAKLHTRKLEISNAKLKVKIAEISEALIKEKEEFEKTLAIRAQIIANLEHDMQMQNFEAGAKLKKKILDSERQMVLQTRAHVVTDELLQEEDEATRESYNNTLKSNMGDEKTLRARRFKVETQLLSWIQKYDNDMMDNQEELDDFTARYEDEEQRVEILEERLAEQDKEFIPLMAEREAEYAQEMTDKLERFRKEHAARILQTSWRQVLANRKEKKKLKRALKKIKEAALKAEQMALKKFQREQKILAKQKKKEAAEAKKNKKTKKVVKQEEKGEEKEEEKVEDA